MLRIHGKMVILCLALAASLGIGVHPASAQAPNPARLVLAFYYTWFDETTWTPARVPDVPVKPYASRDRAAMAQHVDQAKAAGIDALVVSWYGHKAENNNQTEPNVAALLEVAQEKGSKIAIDFETASPFLSGQGDIVAALQHLINVHASKPAYLRYDGKPVIFFWAIQRVPTAPGQSPLDAWRAIRQQVDPDRRTLWIAEGVDIQYQDVFDGHHLYSVAWSKNVNQTLSDWSSRVRKWSAAHNGANRLWVATVMPGYNDLRTGRTDAFVRERDNGQFYQNSWQAAVNSQPDWVMITSFNEWVEGTQIEPSQSYGNLYLDLTRDWAARFKSGQGAAPVEPTAGPQAQPTATISPTAPAVEPTTVVTPTSVLTRTATVSATLTLQPTPVLTATSTVTAALTSADRPTATVTVGRVAGLAATPPVEPTTRVAAAPTLQPTAKPSDTPAVMSVPGTVIVDRLPVRAGPGDDYAAMSFLRRGDAVQILNGDPDAQWLQVSGSTGEEGFVSAKSLEWTPVPQVPGGTESPDLLATPMDPVDEAVVLASGSKLRKGPGSSYGPLTKLNLQDALLVLGMNAEQTWLRVRMAGGQEGWVDAKVVRFGEAAPETSPVSQFTVTPTLSTAAPSLVVTPGDPATVPIITRTLVAAPTKTSVFYSAVTPTPSLTAATLMTPVTATATIVGSTMTPSPSPTFLPPAAGVLPQAGPRRTQAIAGGLLVLIGGAALVAAIGCGAMYLFSRRRI